MSVANLDETSYVAVMKQVASLAAAGTSQNQIAEQLGLNKHQVKKILSTPACKKLITEVGDTAMSTAISVIKNRTAGLVDKALKALECSLDEGELEAVKLVFKTVGVLDAVDKPQGETNITIVAPGAAIKHDTPVEAEFFPIGNDENN